MESRVTVNASASAVIEFTAAPRHVARLPIAAGVSPSSSAAARSPIDLVERAYAVDGDLANWLAHLGEAAVELDRGMGVVAMVQRIGADAIRTPTFVAFGNPNLSLIVEAIQRASTDAMTEHFGRALTSSGSYVDQITGLPGDGLARFEAAMTPWGVRDTLGMTAQDARGWHLVFVAPSPTKVDPAATPIGRWSRVATHLGAGLRLRRMLEHGALHAEAVMTPSGRVVHAETAAQSSLERLGDAVVASERARGRLRWESPDEALSLWDGLVSGRWSLVDRIESDGRRYVVAVRNALAVERAPSLSQQEAVMVRYAVGGALYKEIAYGVGLAESTVGWHLRNAMNKLGVANRVELMALWRAAAAHGRDRIDEAAVTLPLDADDERALPDIATDAPLSPAERSIAAAAARGLSNKAIAEARQSTPQTVANILSRAFKKLGVTTRAELVKLLSERDRA